MSWFRKIKSNYTVRPGTPYESKLVPTQDTAKYMTVVRFDSDETSYMFTFRPLAGTIGDMVYSTGYIVVQYDGPRDEIFDHVMKSVNNFNGYNKEEFSFRNPMLDMLNKATGESYVEHPEFIEEGDEESKTLPKGITVGGSDTLMIIGPYPSEVQYYVKYLSSGIEKSILPMVENNAMEFVSVESEAEGDRITKSDNYKKTQESNKNAEESAVSYFKYVYDIVLRDYASLKETMDFAFGDYKNIEPSSEKVDIKNSTTINYVLDNNGRFFKEVGAAVLDYDEDKLNELSEYYETAKLHGLNYQDIDEFLYYIKEEILLKKPYQYVYLLAHWVRRNNGEFLKELGYGDAYNQLLLYSKRFVEEALEREAIREVERFSESFDLLNLSEAEMEMINGLRGSRDAEKKKVADERERARIDNSYYLNWDEAYINLKESDEFHEKPRDYRNSTFREFLEHQKDELDFPTEELSQGAYEKAGEELNSELPARESENLPYDREAAIEHMKWDSDDFLEEMNFWDSNEEMAQQASALATPVERRDFYLNIVMNNYFDQFVQWKVEKLIIEEEEESYKYEIDPQEEEKKVTKILADMVYEEFINNGYVHVDAGSVYSGDMWYIPDVTFYVHSRYAAQLLPIVQKFVKLNSDEGNIDDKTNAFIEHVDDGGGQEVPVPKRRYSSWYRKIKTASVRGEYWIDDRGECLEADGDSGDYNHERHVIETVQCQYLDNCDESMDWDEQVSEIGREHFESMTPEEQYIIRGVYENDPFDFGRAALMERGMTSEEWEIANGNGDVRLFAMINWGWKRVEGNNVETYHLKASDLLDINDGLYECYFESVFRAKFNIYVMSTNKWYTDIPYMELENGLSALRGRESFR
jgi:hypothetical protein